MFPFDKFFPTCIAYTPGHLSRRPTPRTQAQLNQINYLSTRSAAARRPLLDVGCGMTLLEEVRRRGAVGTGITISPEQAGLCRRRGLDVRLLDYRELAGRSIGPFDAVIANGAIEHFVQVSDAAAGEAEQIYARMFRLFHGMHPKSHPADINTDIRPAASGCCRARSPFSRLHYFPRRLTSHGPTRGSLPEKNLWTSHGGIHGTIRGS